MKIEKNENNLYEYLEDYFQKNKENIIRKGLVTVPDWKTIVYISDDGEIENYDHFGNTSVDGVILFENSYSEDIMDCHYCDGCSCNQYQLKNLSKSEREKMEDEQLDCVVEMLMEDFNDNLHDLIMEVIEKYENKIYEIFEEDFQ